MAPRKREGVEGSGPSGRKAAVAEARDLDGGERGGLVYSGGAAARGADTSRESSARPVQTGRARRESRGGEVATDAALGTHGVTAAGAATRG
jgi:hypothetical protein